MEQIIVLIDPETAAVKIEVKGVSGSGCAKLTEALEKALGETTEDTKTHAYHEPARSKVHADHRA